MASCGLDLFAVAHDADSVIDLVECGSSPSL